MSTLKVEVTEVLATASHPNADRLDLITVFGWQCVAPKGEFKVGDKCIYIPIDSLLPHEVESKIFGPDSKVKLHHSRVKTIKLRGAISQGLIVAPSLLGFEKAKIGTDITDKLGVKKYEPPVNLPSGYGNTRVNVSKKQVNPHFHKYTDIENFKNYPKVFEDGEIVTMTEKIHGTNFRCGYVPFNADTIWKKIKKFFGRAPKFEFVYGSRTVQLQNKVFYDGFYKTNVYAEIVKKYNLQEILLEGEVVYGEIYGAGIQKNYNYGLKEGEQQLALFDVIQDGKYVDTDKFTEFCLVRQLPMVPEVYKGPFSMEKAKELSQGVSVLAPEQKVREGVVIKPMKETHTHMGRKVLKFINDEYLLKDNSDFH